MSHGWSPCTKITVIHWSSKYALSIMWRKKCTDSFTSRLGYLRPPNEPSLSQMLRGWNHRNDGFTLCWEFDWQDRETRGLPRECRDPTSLTNHGMAMTVEDGEEMGWWWALRSDYYIGSSRVHIVGNHHCVWSSVKLYLPKGDVWCNYKMLKWGDSLMALKGCANIHHLKAASLC